MIKHIELNIDQLLLDKENPRLGEVATQSQALESLIDLNHSHFRNLMQNIKENGLDPGDSLYVINADDEGDYTVLEGNRRLAALKVLVNPDIVVGTSNPDRIKKSLATIAKGFDRKIVEPVQCVVFENRVEANDWIYRRHTGEAEGVGRIGWATLVIQKFAGDRSVSDVIEFYGANVDHNAEEWASTKALIESNKSSTLARLLASKSGRAHLGIDVIKVGKEMVPTLSSNPEWTLKVLKRVFEDLKKGRANGGIDSRNVNATPEIEQYFKELPPELQPTATLKVKARPFKDIKLTPSGNAVQATIGKPIVVKTSLAPRTQDTLAPKQHSFKNPTSIKGKKLLTEASNIDAGKLTIASAFVLRAFIELSIRKYSDDNSLPKTKPTKGNPVRLKISELATAVVAHIKNATLPANGDLDGFVRFLNGTGGTTSMIALQDFLHDNNSIPTADELKSVWAAAVPVFDATFGKA